MIDLDQATKPDDPLLELGTHVMASAEALRGTTGLKRIRRWVEKARREHFRLSRRHRWTERRLLARPRRAAPHAGLQGEGDRLARRRRRLSRRLHAGAGGRARAARRSALCQRRRRAQMHQRFGGPTRRGEIEATFRTARRGESETVRFSVRSLRSRRNDRVISSTDRARRRVRRRRRNLPARPRGRSTG